MTDLSLIAPCGIDCMNCPLQMSNITAETRNRMAARTGKVPTDVDCPGCRARKGKNLPLASECKTYECVTAKNVEYCSDCPEFPCAKLAPCAYRAEVFPHNMKVFNLCRMKTIGVDAWAAEVKSIREHYYKGVLIPGAGPELTKS